MLSCLVVFLIFCLRNTICHRKHLQNVEALWWFFFFFSEIKKEEEEEEEEEAF
jgi:hypothetical protein